MPRPPGDHADRGIFCTRASNYRTCSGNLCACVRICDHAVFMLCSAVFCSVLLSCAVFCCVHLCSCWARAFVPVPPRPGAKLDARSVSPRRPRIGPHVVQRGGWPPKTLAAALPAPRAPPVSGRWPQGNRGARQKTGEACCGSCAWVCSCVSVRVNACLCACLIVCFLLVYLICLCLKVCQSSLVVCLSVC